MSALSMHLLHIGQGTNHPHSNSISEITPHGATRKLRPLENACVNHVRSADGSRPSSSALSGAKSIAVPVEAL